MVRRHHHRGKRNNVQQPVEQLMQEDSSSPAARYRAFQERRQRRASVAQRFADTLDFPLDEFQRQAIDALENGENVIVAAPTGAGKTVIADFAVFLAQDRNVKAFYTTPIKALSNQKYHDLVAIYGSDRVGLLTGDTSINSEADIVVMTTEVLRNMLYEHSTTLTALRYVVLDEVHYLADRFRGPVWEEVIIHLPEQVRVVGLSATVSNVEDFSAWIESARGDAALVVSERRPVPLRQHVMVQSDERHEPEIYDLYRSETSTQLNPSLVSRIAELDRKAERRGGRPEDRKRRHRGRGSSGSAVQRYTPKRWAVVDELNYLDLLPGIYFIFSRTGCDMAVQQCINAGLELTTVDEARRIRSIVDEMVDGRLTRDEMKTLRFSRFRFALEEGFAPHHAGMIALFREIVEKLFEESLVKMVFATETLALGINMPARCVVVEKLEKFNGIGHVPLTPGEFTQLTGRAGRRGIDSIGHAVVVDHRGFQPQTAAALSSKRVYPLHSSFRPTFNMAVNLLNSSDYHTARATLDHSFAQWEANESAEALEERITTLNNALNGYERAFECSQGDFREFLTIRMRLTDLERNERRELKHRDFHSDAARKQAFHDLDERIAQLRRLDKEHPCRQCGDLAQHMRWGHRWMRETRELERVKGRYDSRTGSVARRFDTICAILQNMGYLDARYADGRGGERRPEDYTLTQRGQLLRRLYSEQDLVLAQCLAEGVFDGVKPADFAALMSAFVYEPRRGESGEPRQYPHGPSGPVAKAADQIRRIWYSISVLCEDMGLEPLNQLNFGMVDITYVWARGGELSEVLDGTDMTGGDFVRTCKRLTDILGQIGSTGPYMPIDGEDTAATARTAADLINRGLVSYSGIDEQVRDARESEADE
ncbi:DEAD/DEAH box helicase [Bifidobacterium sp. SMB2]|uniref:DEAD/DEAH box helicase n=1 Tax=Bifidobacterium saimiriisciurei TaxID=2661627 RepID=A0ABX0CG27_9BIFI|nr:MULTISPECIES: DEAD/DEAH box helicase [Bifidobacterium]NEG96857.1 DEAD/DEAH box helicase [Bifidobacterium sp. SMB2]NEH11613.1 DEAD/DEAH box helicase [Bifidobacterium saimiriisciurei]